MDPKFTSADWLGLQISYLEAVRHGQLDRFNRRRWQQSDSFAEWLQPENLASLASRQATTLYRASGGRQVADFGTNTEDDLRDSLDFLLYDTITLEARFAECASPQGAFKLAGAGKEFISYVLCLKNPGLFGIWNAASERTLRRLGLFTPTMAKGHLGLGYLEVLESLAIVRQRMGLEHFRQVDEFCYVISRGLGVGAK
ncbi:MAG: hypothetical protein ACE5Q6_10990 [Dehalococcoidia bacterium]